MIAGSLVSRLLGPKVWMGALLAIALVAAGYVGYTTWKRANLEVRLNEATVEVIRQDALIEKQNDEVHDVQEEGRQQNVDANLRAIKELTKPQPTSGTGPDAMNQWLKQYEE